LWAVGKGCNAFGYEIREFAEKQTDSSIHGNDHLVGEKHQLSQKYKNKGRVREKGGGGGATKGGEYGDYVIYSGRKTNLRSPY